LWTILGGFLLLPVGAAIKLAPAIPPLDKTTVPNLAVLAGISFLAHRPLRFWNRIGLVEVLVFVFLCEPFITSLLNSDPLYIGGGKVLPAADYYDGLAAVEAQFIFLLPFFVGHQFLRSEWDITEVLRALVVAGLLYTLPSLIELRVSPQFHNWIYGYQPSNFDQEVREGGWRPMVLTGHGLLLAFFLMQAAVSAAALWCTQKRVTRFSPSVITAYLSLVLLLCRSAGAAVYAIVLIPLIRVTKPRLQLSVATLLVSFALLYPILRSADLVPTKTLLDAASTFINPERANSLNVRFENEEQLLGRASQRFWFGWGRFGRSRVYNPENGGDASITDGRWIIVMGEFGFIGFLAEFGLLALPVFRAASTLKFIELKEDRIYLAALSLLIAINMIDLLPNSSIGPMTWLLAGALLGRCEEARMKAPFRKFAVNNVLPVQELAPQDHELLSPLRNPAPVSMRPRFVQSEKR